MRKIYLRFRVLLLTFAIGLAGVWFTNYKEYVDNSAIIEESEMTNSTIIYVQPRFIKTADVSHH